MARHSNGNWLTKKCLFIGRSRSVFGGFPDLHVSLSWICCPLKYRVKLSKNRRNLLLINWRFQIILCREKGYVWNSC